MSEELRQPAVVDLDALLQPIPGENPSGEYLRYSGLYDEVGEARRQDENLSQGAWQTELKVADFRRVIELVNPALASQTKDLQLGIWLTEALIKQHGLVGLRDGLTLMHGLQANFWDTVHPQIEDGDMEGRANAVAWLESNGAFAIKGCAFTGSNGYSFRDLEDSKRYDTIDSIDGTSDEGAKLRSRAESGQLVTGDLWRKEVAESRRAPMERINFTIEECLTAFDELNQLVEEKFDLKQAPGLGSFRKALVEIRDEAKKILEVKRMEEPDAVMEEAGPAESVGADGTAKAAGAPRGAIQDRRDALKRLGEIAEYFQRTEPHSPVSYLVQRAVKWGSMPLEAWLQDVIKDDNIISALRQTLGFNTSGEPPAT